MTPDRQIFWPSVFAVKNMDAGAAFGLPNRLSAT